MTQREEADKGEVECRHLGDSLTGQSAIDDPGEEEGSVGHDEYKGEEKLLNAADIDRATVANLLTREQIQKAPGVMSAPYIEHPA